jgi:hypothetical protein
VSILQNGVGKYFIHIFRITRLITKFKKMNMKKDFEKISESAVVGGTRITIARTEMDKIGSHGFPELHY